MNTGVRQARLRPAVWLFIMGLASSGACAQGNSAGVGPSGQGVSQCQRDVLKYQSNIELVRTSLGEKAAEDLRAKFMSKEQMNDLLLKEGYCGVSRRLREAKLVN